MFSFTFQHVKDEINLEDPNFLKYMKRIIGKGSEALVYDNGKKDSPKVAKIIFRNLETIYIAQSIDGVFPEIDRFLMLKTESGTPVLVVLMEKMDMTLEGVQGVKNEAAKILKKLHQQGYILGDVYPANFMLKENKIRIVDFGKMMPSRNKAHFDSELQQLQKRFK